MQIEANGKRNISLDYELPKKFRLSFNGVEVPYLRTGKNSIRLSKDINGLLDVEEVPEAPQRIVKPVQLQPQQMALVNPADVIAINQAAQQLEIEQNILNENQKRFENVQNYIDVQQQQINQSIVAVNELETNNEQRIGKNEQAIFNLAGEIARVDEDLINNGVSIISELESHKTADNPHNITKKTINLENVDNTADIDKPVSKAMMQALNEKADKSEVEQIREEIAEYQDKTEKFNDALANYTGGVGGNELPIGGFTGQVLAKKSDLSGDYEWKNIEDAGAVNSVNGQTGDVVLTINDLTTTAQQNALNSGATSANIGQITTNTASINTINGKIPSQASSSNQLADKNFVNSSIATNTANFIGTFANVSDLRDYQGEVTNNDYAFVVNSVVTDNGGDWGSFEDLDQYDKSLLTNFDYGWVKDDDYFDLYRFDIVYGEWELRATAIAKESVTLNTAYNRYKATVTDSIIWDYEYTLNNSSFTAAQWEAINSGITSGDVALIQTALQSVTWGMVGGTLSNQTDLQNALDGKVDITTSNSRVYGTNGSGQQTVLVYATAANANTLAYRTTNGKLLVGTPTADGHAATKKYVDDADALKVAKAGDTMTGDLETTAAIYLESIATSVSSSASKIVFGTPANPYSYISANKNGAFGIYNSSNQGITCYPDTTFYSNSGQDLGRANNKWKDLYVSGKIYTNNGNISVDDLISGANATKVTLRRL